MSRPFLLADHLGDPCIVCASRERGLSLAEIAAAVEISASVIRLHTLHIETPRKRAAKEARVSSSGAVGLGQIKPSTLRDIDPRLNAWEPWDNLLGSACYLRQQFDRFGTWRKALHAYHGGPNRKATRQATHDYATDIIEASN